jgi:hypothetical protein
MYALPEGLPQPLAGRTLASPKLLTGNRVSITSRELRSEGKAMKRAIAGILLLVAMSVAPALAWERDRGLRRDIRHDEVKIAHDRRELRHDLRRGDYAAARHERRELRREYRDVNRDRRALDWDRR